MLDGLTPDLAPRLILAIGGVGVAFLVLIAVLLFLRKRNSPLFIKGGKSREPRLMVLDAAAVDAKRRLVLIRRDNVEHLIMIGGPTDIVIESGIGAKSAKLPEHPIAPQLTNDPVLIAKAHAEPAAEQPVRAEPKAVDQVVAKAEPARETGPVVANRIQQPEVKTVSAMGAVLYDEDREAPPVQEQVALSPLPERATAYLRPAVAQPAVVAQTTLPQQVLTAQNNAAPEAAAPLAVKAEDILDQARSRVLSAQPADARPSAMDDATKALAARLDAAKLESARLDAARRAQASQALVPPVVPAAPSQKPASEFATSDFEKLLEAELEAGGIFDGERMPDVIGETRGQPTATFENRRSEPAAAISGASADMTAEREMARLLGEMALNKKV